MDVKTHKVREISILKAVYDLGLNPENVLYSRNTSTQATVSNMRWTVYAPSQGMGLLPFSKHEIDLSISKSTVDNANANSAASNWSVSDKISLKEGLPLANATDSAAITINGDITNFNRVRDWAHQLSLAVAGNKMKTCNSSGGKFWKLNGLYPEFETFAAGGNGSTDRNVPRHDEHLLDNEQDFLAKLYESNDNAIPAAAVAQFKFEEPLIIPPFNPFYPLCDRDEVPDYLWFKKMTKSIPHIDRIDYNLNLSGLAASLFFPRGGFHDANADRIIKVSVDSVTSANLLLYWYRYPTSVSVPREISINSWYVRNYDTPLIGAAGGLINDDVELQPPSTNQIELYSVPELIMVSVRRSQSEASYEALALTSWDSGAATTNRTNTGNLNSMDMYCEISQIDVQMGDRTNIINTSLTSEELYGISMSNINYEDYPYDYVRWKGHKGSVPAALAQAAATTLPVAGSAVSQAANFQGRCCLYFRPKDLGVPLPSGVVTPLTMKLSNLRCRARSSFSSQASNHNYTLYVTAFYGNYMIGVKDGLFRTAEINVNSMSKSRGDGVGGSVRRRGAGSGYMSRV